MTTPEHTLVGIHTAFAFGLDRKFGWAIVVVAAVSSNLPDWDGLLVLLDISLFDKGHRVWGHNFLWIGISSFVLAMLQYRYRVIEFSSRRLENFLPQGRSIRPHTVSIPFSVLVAVCFASQTIHLLCDMVVSGGKGLSDWLVRPFWPFSDIGYVLALIPWGDIGPTIILMVGAIMVAKYPPKLNRIAAGTLATLMVYLLIRGWSRGVL